MRELGAPGSMLGLILQPKLHSKYKIHQKYLHSGRWNSCILISFYPWTSFCSGKKGGNALIAHINKDKPRCNSEGWRLRNFCTEFRGFLDKDKKVFSLFPIRKAIVIYKFMLILPFLFGYAYLFGFRIRMGFTRIRPSRKKPGYDL